MKSSVVATAAIIASAAIFNLTSAFADNVSFNYQGRVKVQSQPFTGTGLLKLAIINTSGSAVLWSNDGTVGTGGGAESLPVPASSVAVPVNDGVFSISVGDETIPGMAPLDSAVMVSNTPLRLRVWFSNGELGFQELKPDHKLTDLSLTTIQTGNEDYTIYVNGVSGNDANNGLTQGTAKKTISGAVNIIPEKIRCNITVSIAPGVYREMVLPHDHSVSYGKSLKFIGDSAWTPSSAGIPSVVIDGANSGSTPVRDYGFYARQCSGLVVEGIAFQNTKFNGLKLENGNYIVNRCLAQKMPYTGLQETGSGIAAGPQAHVYFNECTSKDNAACGFEVHSSSRAYLTTCTASNNNIGLFAVANSGAQLFSYNDLNNNNIGMQGNTFSSVSVWPNSNSALRTRIRNNKQQAIVVNWQSSATPADAVMTGNAALYLRYYGTIVGVDPQ